MALYRPDGPAPNSDTRRLRRGEPRQGLPGHPGLAHRPAERAVDHPDGDVLEARGRPGGPSRSRTRRPRSPGRTRATAARQRISALASGTGLDRRPTEQKRRFVSFPAASAAAGPPSQSLSVICMFDWPEQSQTSPTSTSPISAVASPAVADSDMRATGREGLQGGRPPTVGPGLGGGPSRAEPDVDAGPGGGLAPHAEGPVPLDDHVVAERRPELDLGGRGGGGERQDQRDGRGGAVESQASQTFRETRVSRSRLLYRPSCAVIAADSRTAAQSHESAVS